MTGTFFGYFDLAQLALYMFWLFFAGLVVYLQRENMREGYPLEDEHGNPAANQGPLSLPYTKTFKLSFGRGEVKAPDMKRETRHIALAPGGGFPGSALEPTGDPMRDGVGPASWAERADAPELDGHGHPKIVPMKTAMGFTSVGAGLRDAPVIGADGVQAGTVSDVWVDRPESMIRYIEVDLGGGHGFRLLPMPLARVWGGKVHVHALNGGQFGGVPTTRSNVQVTLLEEDKICAWYAGGKLYADPARAEPML